MAQVTIPFVFLFTGILVSALLYSLTKPPLYFALQERENEIQKLRNQVIKILNSKLTSNDTI